MSETVLVWRHDVLEVRVWGGRWFKRNVGWRGSVEETEAAAQPVLERLVEHVDEMLAGAPVGGAPPLRAVLDGPTFDPAPLLRQARLALPDGVGHRIVAELLGTSRRQLYRWRQGARLQRDVADDAACRLGLHPVLIWPDW